MASPPISVTSLPIVFEFRQYFEDYEKNDVKTSKERCVTYGEVPMEIAWLF